MSPTLASNIIIIWLVSGLAAYTMLLLAIDSRHRPADFGQAIQSATWQPRTAALALAFCIFLPFVALPMQVYELYKRYLLYRQDIESLNAEEIERGLAHLAQVIRNPGSTEAREMYRRIWQQIEELRQRPVNQREELTMKAAADWLAGAYAPQTLTENPDATEPTDNSPKESTTETKPESKPQSTPTDNGHDRSNSGRPHNNKPFSHQRR